MISQMTEMLKLIISENVPLARIGVRPPDKDWRNWIAGGLKVNIYLVNVYENMAMRSTERKTTINNGIVEETPSPRWVECCYLITAWSEINDFALNPLEEEYAMLQDIIGTLMRHDPIVPAEINHPLPAGIPAEYENREFRTELMSPEGFDNMGEFWSTMEETAWRPGIYLKVSVPILPPSRPAGPMVTTRISHYHFWDPDNASLSESSETLIQIGGLVIDATGGSRELVANALVEIFDLDDPAEPRMNHQVTAADGRFTFTRLRQGNIRLRAQVAGQPPVILETAIPSPEGNYELIYE